LDGTLLDTLPDIAEAANRMLADLGRPPAALETVRAFIGKGIARLAKRLLTGTLDGEPAEGLFARALPLLERHYRETYTARSRPFPGVRAGLERLHGSGLALACVTNKPEAFTVPLLTETDLLRWFALVVCGDSLPRGKPDPLPLRHAAQRLSLAAPELLVVGDSDNDVEAARGAGCAVVCVDYGYAGSRQVRDLGADAIVSSLEELPPLISTEQRL
jgi:phosphoglycolate phosphatase